MTVRRDYKVPGGKLLRIELEVEAGIARKVLIRGDFFAHPEEAFESAESELAGLPAESVGDAALSLFARPPLRLFGASPDDIAAALREALDAAKIG